MKTTCDNLVTQPYKFSYLNSATRSRINPISLFNVNYHTFRIANFVKALKEVPSNSVYTFDRYGLRLEASGKKFIISDPSSLRLTAPSWVSDELSDFESTPLLKNSSQAPNSHNYPSP